MKFKLTLIKTDLMQKLNHHSQHRYGTIIDFF